MKNLLILTGLVLLFSYCSTTSNRENEKETIVQASSNVKTTFKNDLNFLREYTDILVLGENSQGGKVALSPALQGRVMTSSAKGMTGSSYGWINRKLLDLGDTLAHINVFGGEERFWLGPEGGQFSIFFEKGKEFTGDNWYTPKFLDLVRFNVIQQSDDHVVFQKSTEITNYSGFTFDLEVTREVKLLSTNAIAKELNIELGDQVSAVAYQSSNTIKNTGTTAWQKETGLLSVWMLGMFNPSPEITVVIPYVQGDDEVLGTKVIDDYFGKVPVDRLVVTDKAIFFKGDGQQRGKIGLTPQRAKDVLGSYDSNNKTLTILKYNKPDGVMDYVNSKWEIQEEPFKGDVVNSYNDGAPEPGKAPLGPFYELESSSPAAALQSGESLTHIQATFHFEGDEDSLDAIAQSVLGVSLQEITSAFK